MANCYGYICGRYGRVSGPSGFEAARFVVRVNTEQTLWILAQSFYAGLVIGLSIGVIRFAFRRR